MNDADGFFARWSRRKVGQQEGGVPPETPAVQPAVAEAAAAVPAPQAVPPPAAEAPPPTLDDVAALAPGDEVSRFVARGVDEAVKRAAMRKLFADPHFNIMDGLDIYIDDYSLPDPIPAAMLRGLNQSRSLGLFADADEDKPQAQAAPAAGTIPDQDAEPQAAPAAEAVPQTDDEDPDLQLQPDDAAGRPGPEEGAGPEGR